MAGTEVQVKIAEELSMARAMGLMPILEVSVIEEEHGTTFKALGDQTRDALAQQLTDLGYTVIG